MNRLY